MNMTLNLEARKRIYLAYVATSRKTLYHSVSLSRSSKYFGSTNLYTGNIKYHVQSVKL